jgi:glycosyltransferase involved in cell wall biosynthesis
MDVLALPSRSEASWKEQFGRVLVEAMASGVPVIGSQSGAIPEVIGDAGLTFRERDAKGLALQVKRLAEDPSLRRHLSNCGRKRFTDYYTPEVVAKQTLAAYAAMCSVGYVQDV